MKIKRKKDAMTNKPLVRKKRGEIHNIYIESHCILFY